MHTMEKRVKRYIEANHLIELGDKVLVALSGGADSVALLRVLLSLGYNCQAIHCNFHLRGEESMRDERFVRDLCSRLNCPLTVHDFDTTGYAAAQGISLEMAAREQRYRLFEEMREQSGAAVTAVAHHRDDSVETILLNLLRGTGISGLTGIAPKRDNIVRPLLCVGRSDILTYLESLRQDYVTDSTNLQETFRRNKVRLDLLPLMRQIEPAADAHILEAAEHLSQVAAVYRRAIEEARLRVMLDNTIKIEPLMQEPSPSALLFEILSPLGFNSSQIACVMESREAQPGKQITGDRYHITKERGCWMIEERDEREEEPVTLPEEGEAEYEGLRLTLHKIDCPPHFHPSHEAGTATLDAGKVMWPLTLRHWVEGDRFIPFGMRGSKLVSDYLTDRKVTRTQRERQTVVCSPQGIVWLTGERIDDRYRVGPATQQILIIKIEKR